MFSVAVYESESKEKNIDEIKSICRKELTNYSTLYSIFSETLASEEPPVYFNPVLIQLNSLGRANEKSLDVFGQQNQEEIKENIRRIEKSINEMKKDLNEEDYKEICAEITSPDFNQVKGLLTHIKLYHYLNSEGFDVIPEPSLTGDKKADLKLEDEEVIIEITSIGNSQIQQDIEKMLNKTGREIINILDENKHLSIHLDSNEFVWKNHGPLDIDSTKEKILSQFKNANTSKLLELSSENKVDFWSFNSDRMLKMNVSELNEPLVFFDDYSNFGKILDESKDSDAISDIKKKTLEDLQGPIETVRAAEAQDKMVIFGDTETYPDGIGEIRERIFLQRLQNKIEEKIDKEQRNPSKNNVLLVSAYFWPYRGYSRNESKDGVDAENKIRSLITKILDREDTEDLSAVLLIEDEPENIFHIENPSSERNLKESEFGEIIAD